MLSLLPALRLQSHVPICLRKEKIKHRYLLSGSQFLLQMLNGLFSHSDLPESIFIRQFLAFLPLSLLQLSHSHPQLVYLRSSRKRLAVRLAPIFCQMHEEIRQNMRRGQNTKEQTSALDLRSAAMSCTLSLCSFGADLYMSNKSFISFWDSCAFLKG